MIARSRGASLVVPALLLLLVLADGALVGWEDHEGTSMPGAAHVTRHALAVRETIAPETAGWGSLASPARRRPGGVPTVPRPDHVLSLALPILPRVLSVQATAYCDHGTTASGSQAGEGILAVSQDLRDDLPFGTPVSIEGRAYMIGDTMSSQWHQRVDIWMASRSRALQWGVRRVVLEVLR